MVVSLLPAKLQAVKWYKERHNCSLSEAKDAVDAIAAKHSSELSFANAGGSGCSIIILIGISITLGAMFIL
jgi:ribosomal protein L7/L12